jgi:hypothetical protein
MRLEQATKQTIAMVAFVIGTILVASIEAFVAPLSGLPKFLLFLFRSAVGVSALYFIYLMPVSTKRKLLFLIPGVLVLLWFLIFLSEGR